MTDYNLQPKINYFLHNLYLIMVLIKATDKQTRTETATKSMVYVCGEPCCLRGGPWEDSEALRESVLEFSEHNE